MRLLRDPSWLPSLASLRVPRLLRFSNTEMSAEAAENVQEYVQTYIRTTGVFRRFVPLMTLEKVSKPTSV